MIESFIIQYSFSILIIGSVLFLASYILPIGQYKIIGQFVGVMLISLGLFFKGKEQERLTWELQMNEARIEIAQLQARASEINVEVISEFYPKIQYVDRVQQQVVTEFVTKKDDSACTINNGFVRLHDAVANQEIIVPEETDSNLSDVQLSQVGSVVKENYSTCYKTAEQLKQLQSWIKQQEKLWNEKK